MLGHVGDGLVVHAALAKQGVGTALTRVGLELALHAQALSQARCVFRGEEWKKGPPFAGLGAEGGERIRTRPAG